ncbi:hypothetical protein C8J57DRAFT_1220541 [Mycena rebaudengoi]|nr:hypothetical protein C8J57DRAFT_1220541 [Mycena rebaudengoi]
MDDLHVRPAHRPPAPRRSTAFDYTPTSQRCAQPPSGAAPTAPASPPPRTPPPGPWHIIHRTTYVAAGRSFDAPMHDLSALCIKSRIASEDGWPMVVEIPQAFELLSLDS